MNIALATDENYLHLVHIALRSLFATNRGDITIHLLTNNVSDVGIRGVQGLVDNEGGLLKVYPIGNLREMLGIDVPATISITSYARLFLPSILPLEVEKVLYIDCDILFTDNIRPFYDTELENTLVGGIQDLLLCGIYRNEIGISSTEPYFNAGILLIPLKRWRQENLQQSFLDYLLAHNGNVFHHDQGIINAVCAGRKTVCPPRYNVISNYFTYPYSILKKTSSLQYTKEVYYEARKHPAIIHYTGVIYGRPWENICCHPYKDLFNVYKASTIYKNLPLKHIELSPIAELECRMYHALPFWAYTLFIKALFCASHIKHKFQK